MGSSPLPRSVTSSFRRAPSRRRLQSGVPETAGGTAACCASHHTLDILLEERVMTNPDWRSVNRANWDERVGVHLGPGGYDLTNLRAGHGRFNPIEEAELPPVAGKRIVHLQCHFGADSLRLAQRGASEVVGLDFSAPAIEAAQMLSTELNLA